jgi:hypothetical protein
MCSTSNDGEGEGARTATARFLSRSALLVVRVSEDEPVTISIGVSSPCACSPDVVGEEPPFRRAVGGRSIDANPLRRLQPSWPSAGLFEHDPAVEGVGQLLVEHPCFAGGTVLEDGDGGDVGERLCDVDVGGAHLTDAGAEQV